MLPSRGSSSFRRASTSSTSSVPLELAGRIAGEGEVLFDDSPNDRVRWVATTRKIWLDERDRFQRAHRTFLEAAANG